MRYHRIMPTERQYIAIDLKSFYASVECVERGLDPLKTNLVVADATRTDKTICLAVTPTLKAYGISGRARLFEVVQRVREVNNERLCFSPEGIFNGRSTHDPDLQSHPDWELDYIVAPPRMSFYMEYSARIYGIYLRYIAPEDIFAYSVDEVFIDATAYLKTYRMTAHQLAVKLVREVLRETGITATAGIGSNLYLSKVAMDIVAKHIPADEDGVRIAELDESAYRRQLWSHRPMTDFWRIGRGVARRLEANGMMTLGDVARRSLNDEALLHKLFGVNAELIIDHAWGYEPCTMKEIKAYRPRSNSFSNSQVLGEPYSAAKARIVLREMADNMALTLVDKKLVASQMTVTVNYDAENLPQTSEREGYKGAVVKDYYGRTVPKYAHGAAAFASPTASGRLIADTATRLYDDIVDAKLLVRRLTITVNNLLSEDAVDRLSASKQLTLFGETASESRTKEDERQRNDREKRVLQATLAIKKKFGKNALLHGSNFAEGATAKDRNRQIGGHKA